MYKVNITSKLYALYAVIGLLILSLFFWWIFITPQIEIQKTQTVDFESFINPEHTIPVITISTASENLWDPEIGLYVEGNHINYKQTGEDWERPAVMKYYHSSETNGFELGFTREIGLRLHGNALRSMPQKAFRIYFKDEYQNPSKLVYPLFDEDRPEVFSTLILRNGDPSYSLIREQVVTTLVSQASEVDVMRGKPVVLYLNGEYWGIYFLRERFDETYFEERYNLDKDYLGLLYAQLGHEPKGYLLADNSQSEQDAVYYNAILKNASACKDCLSAGTADSQIDVQNMIDYYFFELYFSNTDWPYNNLKAWRYKTQSNFPPESELIPELDGRFRWLLFDFDGSMGAGNITSEKMIDSARSNNSYGLLIDNDFPLRNLFYDDEFRQFYHTRSTELLDTVLDPENTTTVINQIVAEIEPEVVRHTERWGNEKGLEGKPVVSDYQTWQEHVALLEQYLQARPEAFKKYTEEFFAKEPK